MRSEIAPDLLSMTVTSAHAGMTALRLRRRLSATLAAVLAVLLLVVAAPALAETPSPTPTLSGRVDVTVGALGNAVVGAGEAASIAVQVDNQTASTVGPLSVDLSLGGAPLTDRAALTAWLSGETPLPGDAPVATAALDAVPSGTIGNTSFFLAPDDPALAGRASGVYPLWVSGGGLTARSTLVVPAGTPATVGVVVPLTAGPLGSGLLTADQLTALTAADGALTVELDAVSGTSAILAIDPAIVAAIRALGTKAPATARTWLARLEELPNQKFALQFGDADVSTQLAAGLSAPWQPTSLVSYLDEADFPETTPATPTPGPTATATPQTRVPDLAALLDVGATGTTYWPPTGTTSNAIVDALATATPGALTLVASTATEQGAAGGTVAARGTTPSGAGVLVYDTAISEALREASVQGASAPRASALATASAHLALATAEAGGAPLLVAVDRDAERTRLGLRAAITAVTSFSGVSSAGLAAISGAAATPVTLVDAAVDANRTAAVGSLSAGAEQIAQFATVLDDPNLLTGADRAESLQLLGAGWLDDTTAWDQAMVDHSADTTRIVNSVSIVPPTQINLLTAGTDLSFWVHNDLPYPVNVIMFAEPDDLRLTVDRQISARIAAADASGASNTPIKLPVRARIANGEVSIALSLTSPTLVPLGQPQNVAVSVRADWETVGLVVLGVLVGGFLTVGVIRTVRRSRRRSRPDDGRPDDGRAEPTDDDARADDGRTEPEEASS